MFRFTYALSCIFYAFNCTVLFPLYTAPFDTRYSLCTGHHLCFFKIIIISNSHGQACIIIHSEGDRLEVSMRPMRGGFIFRNRGPSLKVHHGQHLASMTKHDTGVFLRTPQMLLKTTMDLTGRTDSVTPSSSFPSVRTSPRLGPLHSQLVGAVARAATSTARPPGLQPQ